VTGVAPRLYTILMWGICTGGITYGDLNTVVGEDEGSVGSS
jgi:hypothetical protein